MRRLILLGGAAAVLAVVVLASSSLAQETSVTLDDISGLGITGSSTLTVNDDGSETVVVMNGSGLDTSGQDHINHIHDGTGCGEGEYGGVVTTLTPLVDDDGDGNAEATTNVNQTDGGDAFSASDIADGAHVLVIHGVDGAVAACGFIPQAAAAQQTTEPTTEPAATAQDAALPSTGSGGPGDGGLSARSISLIVAGLALIGLSGLGLSFAMGRSRR